MTGCHCDVSSVSSSLRNYSPPPPQAPGQHSEERMVKRKGGGEKVRVGGCADCKKRWKGVDGKGELLLGAEGWVCGAGGGHRERVERPKGGLSPDKVRS